MQTLSQTHELLDQHRTTYHRFMLGLKWLVLHLAALMIFLVLWFATPAGFASALCAALVVVAIGVYAMNHGLAHSTENDAPPPAA